MGNHLPRPLLDPPKDWHAYVKGSWRSARVRELDALAGLTRPPLVRGASFQKKLEYLGSLIGGRADEMQGLFEQFDTAIKHIGSNLETKTRLSTSDADAIKGLLSLGNGSGEIAAWRLRIQAARRRLILTVWVAVRFQRTVKRPSRLRRVDSFSYMIPDFLGPDASKFVDEQVKYAEAMKAQQSDNDADGEGEGAGEEDEDRWSPDSEPLKPMTPAPLAACKSALALPTFTLGRQPARRASVPGMMSSTSPLDRSRPQTQASRRGGPAAGGPPKPNFFRPFQTYKRTDNMVPSEPSPLHRRGSSYAGSSVAGAVPALAFRVSASGAEGKRGKSSCKVQLQSHDLPLSRQPTSGSSRGRAKAPPPLTPKMAFLSESLRLPSIAASGSSTTTRPLRHKSSLVQHWITDQGNITRQTLGTGTFTRASYSGGFPLNPPATSGGLSFRPPAASGGAWGGFPPQPPATAPGRPGPGMLPHMQRASSPGGMPVSVSASMPSLEGLSSGVGIGGAELGGGGGEGAALSAGSVPAWESRLGGSEVLTIDHSNAGDSSGAASGVGDAGGRMPDGGPVRPRLGSEGGAAAFGSRAASRRQIMFADRPRVKWDAADAQSQHGPQTEAGGLGQGRSEVLLLPASSSEPVVFPTSTSPPGPDRWAHGGASAALSGPESSHTTTLKLGAVPKPPWGPPAQHGRFSANGRNVLLASLAQHVSQQEGEAGSQEEEAGGLSAGVTAPSTPGPMQVSHVSFQSRASPSKQVLDEGNDSDSGSAASGRSVATSVFSVYNSEYQFGESEFEEERDMDVDDALLLDPAYWRQHAEEQSSSAHEDSPQCSVKLPGMEGDEASPVPRPPGAQLRGSIRRPVSGKLKTVSSRGIQWRDTQPLLAEVSEALTQETLRSEESAEQLTSFTPVSAAVVLRPGLSMRSAPVREGSVNRKTVTLQKQATLKRQATLLARNMSRRRGVGFDASDDLSEEDDDQSESDQLGVLARCKMMMRMYVNRCNAAWAEQQGWAKPTVYSLAEQRAWQSSAQCRQEISSVQQAVRTGKFALWFLAGEDHLPAAKADSTAGYSLHDIWSADPYALIRNCRPGLLHGKSPQKSHTYQSRALGQLSLAVTAAGGKRALERTCIVLHINDEQQEEVTRALWDYKFYGFERENCIIVMQPKRPGYRYDPASRSFVAASGAATHPETTGTGLAAMQLNWCPDAYVLSTDGMLEALHATVLEVLMDKGVEHLLCHRARDMAVLDRDQVLDLPFLAQGRWLHSTEGNNMTTQVLLSDSMAAARSLNSVVLTLESRSTNTEMRMGEMSSHPLSKAISAAKADNGGKVTIGLQRYLFHLPSLKSMLSSNEHFRPRLRLHDELLFVSFDIANVTNLPGASLAAVQVAEQPPLLMSRKELSQLLQTVQKQDADDVLMNLLDSLQPPRLTAAAGLVSAGSQTLDSSLRLQSPGPIFSSGTNTVVLVDGNLCNLAAVRMAVALARPGRRDTVRLVMFVADEMQVAQGQKRLVRLHERLGSHGHAHLCLEVLVHGANSLLGAMQQHVAAVGAELVVVPSATLGRPNAQDILGSVALAILKIMEVPVLLVTPRCSRGAELLLERRQLRMMVMVEGWSMPLLEFASDRILVPSRGDKVLLGQAFSSRTSTRQQMDHRRWHLADFRDFLITNRNVTNVEDLMMDGDYDTVVQQAIVESNVNLLGVHLPPGAHMLPKSFIALLCNSQAAVLVMKRKLSTSVQA